MSSRFAEFLDEAERVRAFEGIEQAAAQLRVGVFIARVDVVPATILYVSDSVATLSGYAVSDLVGKPAWELMVPEQQGKLRQLIESRGPDAPPITLDLELAHADGARRKIEVGISRIKTNAGALLSIGYFRDVSEERQIVSALAESEARFRSLIDGAPDGVVILKEGGVIALANPVAGMLLGKNSVDAVIGRPIAMFLPPADVPRAGERIGRIMRGEVVGPSVYGVLGEPEAAVEIKSMPCEWDGKPAVLAFARDITDRRRLERELVRADRLAAVGTMAAAVAHEINNPLTYVQLSLQRLERGLRALPDLGPEGPRMLEHLRNALHGTDRVATIVRDLRTFARDGDAEEPARAVDLTTVAERVLKMVEHDIRHRASLVRRYAPIPTVLGSAPRLEQVLLNLVINAIHALPAGDPHRDQIVVDLAERDGEVFLTVKDTGVGIPPADQERVFDPFFTTKPVGEGTGLGLAVCKRIVEGMGGTITITSKVGEGTMVLVRIPGSNVARTITQPPPMAPANAPRLRVLVVDDEPLVRRVIRLSLADRHEVTDVADGEAALVALAAGTIDVILCDLMMPGMSGRDLHERIRELYPGLERRVVFVTGGAFQPRLAEWIASVANPRLIKPFTEGQVLAAVEEAMRD